ncbi:MAG TPA: Stk1 family PASTA domain-containing Ser/Thr kinase [Mycobacteriales bacterium]|nr:Stk1 family PASTA domain-containing Ser/Thr kinase [Mycobacteriales bacterium]
MDAPPVDPMVGRLLDGRYSVDSFIAHGGMASVYLATDTRLERRVAVKVLHAHLAGDHETLARFQREARAAARLSHPDVVAVYDQGTDGDRPFLVMEFVPGANLRAVLRDRGLLTPGETLAVMDHVLAALAAAHRAGLVHRDIKPENVLLTADGRVKVADFGLARAVAGSTVTTTGSVLFGTAAYLAPEQFEHGTADERSDVYSAGVLMFELLTGRTPFEGDSAYAVLHQHASQNVPAPSTRTPGIPPQLDALVTWATARDPAQRPTDANELHDSLVDVRDKLSLHAAVPGLPVTATAPLAATTPPPTPTNALTQAVAAGSVADAAPPQGPTRHRGQRSASGPRFGRRGWIVAGLVGLLIVAAGVLGWYFALGRYTHAPALLGETRPAADAALKRAGLHAKWLKPVYSDQYAQNQVAVESPGPGDRVGHGGTVSLRLSLGPAHIPSVSGDTVAAATAALRAVGVTVSSEDHVYNETLKSGLVIKTDKPVGQEVQAGSSVILFVSKGPKPVAVPDDLDGQSVAAATAELSSLGFLVDSDQQRYSNTVAKGDVIASVPGGGVERHQGDIIKLVVSEGPEYVDVPNVEGESLVDAINALKAAGFKVDDEQFAPGGPQQVFRETPLGKQKVGTTIEIDYY